jgi:hypothetical protein
VTDGLAPPPAAQLVPASYAEKTMASLMQLHAELMDEKERRVDLYRRLMEREQALAELKMYVKVLEERLTPSTPVAPVSAPGRDAAPAVAAPQARPAAQPASPPCESRTGPRLAARPRADGWKTW